MSAVMRRLNKRRLVLMERLEAVQEKERRGEGSTTWLEIELICDEMAHIATLYEVLLLSEIKENLDRMAAVGSDG